MITQHQDTGQENINRYKERISNFSKEFELGLFIYLAKRSLIWITLFFVIAFVTTYIILRYTPSSYQAASVIQVQTGNSASRILNVTNAMEAQEDEVLQAIELLRSKEFLKRSLLKLPLRVAYFAEGTFLEYEHYNATPYSVIFDTVSQPAYGSRFYIDFDTDHSGTLQQGIDPSGPKIKFNTGDWFTFGGFSLLITVHDMAGIELLKSSVKDNTLFFAISSDQSVVNTYSNSIGVRLLNDAARTIEISCTDQNAVKARDIVNILANEFKAYDKEKKGESARKILDFVDDQISKVEGDLKLSESSILTFKRDNKVTASDKYTEINISRLNAIENDMMELELEENVLKEIQASIEKNKEEDSYSLLPLLAGTDYELTLTRLIEDLQKILKEREIIKVDVTANNERLKTIELQLASRRKVIIESIAAIKEKLKLKRENLRTKKLDYESKFTEIPSDELEYQRIQRLFGINEKFYTMLLEKRTEYRISQAGNISQHEILEYSEVPGTPVYPRKKSFYISASILAFLLSLVVVLVRYIFHDKINSLNEIIKATQASISVLGIVPKYKREIPNSQLLVDKNPKSLIAEAFRSIRTNLQFINNTAGPKVMAITSTISGEGKTFIAINLAGIIAFSGKKVIILDLDMRKPKIHIGFQAANTCGMSTILIGKDSLEKCIQHSVQENLHFITAGPIPPNPSELILSPKMHEVIEELKKSYDLVVIDNPPVGLVTDGVTMIQKADYPIYILRADYSRRNFVHNIDRLFNESGIKNLAVVLNGVDIERKSYGYNYGYGYGYGYGAGYGYYEDQKPDESK